MSKNVFPQPKDPAEAVNIAFDWSNRLAPGELIVSHVWTVPAALDITPFDDATASRINVTGGEPGESYPLTSEVTTDSTPPQILKRTRFLEVAER